VSADGSRYEQVLTGAVRPADTAPPDAAAVPDAAAIPAAWSRAYVRDLEDRYACSPAGNELAQLERRIVGASLRFGVLCRFTAFLAVDSRTVTDGGTPHRVTQPVELPAGWAAEPELPLDARPEALLSAAPMAASSWQPSAPTAPVPAAQFSAPRSPRMGFAKAKPAPARLRATGRPAARGSHPAGRGMADPAALPGWVLEQIKSDIDWLDSATPGPTWAMTLDLADPGSRLGALIDWLTSMGVVAGSLGPLRSLVTRLQALDRTGETAVTDSALAVLRREARRVLAEYLAELAAPVAPRGPASEGDGAFGQGPDGRAFWKRRV